MPLAAPVCSRQLAAHVHTNSTCWLISGAAPTHRVCACSSAPPYPVSHHPGLLPLWVRPVPWFCHACAAAFLRCCLPSCAWCRRLQSDNRRCSWPAHKRGPMGHTGLHLAVHCLQQMPRCNLGLWGHLVPAGQSCCSQSSLQAHCATSAGVVMCAAGVAGMDCCGEGVAAGMAGGAPGQHVNPARFQQVGSKTSIDSVA